MHQPIYAIGDIHGHSDELEQVLSLIEADGGPDARIVFLGDYVDRGPDSKAVIQRLASGMAEGRNWICLKGNHDRMFEWFMEETPRHDPHLLVGFHWFHDRIGGIQTLNSYGIDVPETIRLEDLHALARDVVPISHLDFLRNLPLFHQHDDLLFVHAGIRPDVPLEQQSEKDLVWIREPFLSHKEPHSSLVVHGHTALKHPTHFGNRVDLDGGAGYGRPLSAAVFCGTDVALLTGQGRETIPREVI